MAEAGFGNMVDYYRRGPLAPYVEAIRSPHCAPLHMVRTRQPAGSFPDPPLPEISLQVSVGTTSPRCRWEVGTGPRQGRFSKGAMILAPADIHCDYEVDDGFELFVVNIPLAEVRARLSPLQANPTGDFGPLHGPLFADPFIFALAECMWAEAAGDTPRGRLFLDAAVLALLTALLGRAEGLPAEQLAPTLARGGLAPWRLKRALECLDAHVEGDVSLDAVAQAVGLSPSHFARAFKAATGTTPWRWLLVRRVERAQALLATTDLPLSEVARACGFGDQSHLGSWFRRLAGTTPKRWRDERRH